MASLPCPLPPSILRHHRDITLCIDIFYVQGIPFFHSISSKLHFRTATQLINRSKRSLLEQFKQICRIYEARGFRINIVRGDGEFKCLTQDILPARFDPAAADDHVDVVERSIQTVKADCRTITHGLPFKRVPRIMVTEMIVHAIRNRNMFPSPDGVSTTLSPLSIVTGAGKN